jgi:hypothetical protein
VVSGGVVNYTPGLTLGKTLSVALPEIRLEQIGEAGGGASLAKVLTTVFDELDTRLLGAVGDLDRLAGQGVHALSGRASQATGLSTNVVEQGLNEALGKVRGLLGGGKE